MLHPFLVTGLVLSILLVERLGATWLTRHPRGRAFIRRHWLLHPNGISLLRMPMGVISVWLVSKGLWDYAIIWFSFWMISDLTDGTIARNCDLETDVGKWLDPLSDKCMYLPVLFYLCLGDRIDAAVRLPLWGVILFTVIDTVGQFSRLFSQKVAANSFGKAKTALITILLGSLALHHLTPLNLLHPDMVAYLMISCNILAFLSFYCKVIPDIWYANSFTLGNFICGLASIWVVCRYGWYTRGFLLVFIGQFFDLFDGRLARKFGSTKRGPLFDDIADATSFGFAVGCIIFYGLAYRAASVSAPAAACLSAIYVGCLLYRLYRFLNPTRPVRKGIFQGMPSPAGAMLACSAVLVGLRFPGSLSGLISSSAVLLASLLMISSIPYKHFGQTLWPGLPKSLKLLFLLGLLIFINIVLVKRRDWEATFVWSCLGLSLLYALGGIARREGPSAETAP